MQADVGVAVDLDQRLFVELFSNWLESTTGEHALNIHNTQVQRCLGDLARVRWASCRTATVPSRTRNRHSAGG